uniref:Uncharacterized protein n=1 Tax=Anguilla anguilla TaxID=7936 RepID=A0A0E9Q5R5_ANGAN
MELRAVRVCNCSNCH